MTDRFKFRVWNNTLKSYSMDDHYIDEDGNLNTDGICYIVEQCTGLKDKNGKLIYEGDIVKYIDYICEVQFMRGCFILHVIKGIKSGFFHFYDMHFSFLEVIGNIHENPELLKEEQ